MRKINNIVAMQLWPVGSTIAYQAGGDGEAMMQEITLVATGPCVLFIRPKAAKGEDEQTFLLDVFEGRQSFQWAFPGEYELCIEPSGPVYYASPAGAVAYDVGDVKSFTRFEKPGLYIDELSFALHQQSVLNGIMQGRERMERDAYQRQLERRLEELTARIDAQSVEPDAAQEEQSAE